MIIIVLVIDSSCTILMPVHVYHTANTGGGAGPPLTANTATGFRGGWYPGYHLPCPPPARGRPTRENRRECAWYYEGTYIFPCRAPPPRGQGTYPG